MTIAVIAANGRSGSEFVRIALEQGLDVRAGVKGESHLVPHEHMVVVPCDATNRDEVRALLEGSDAVVSMIGHGRHSPARVQTDAMKVIVDVMHELKITRLVSLTGTGVRFPGDKPSLVDYLANFAIRVIDPNRVQDGIDHARLLEATDLEWTILRVLKLGNGEHKGMVKLTPTGPAELLTPRSRAAAAALQVITDASYVRQAPVISGYTKL